VRAGTEMPPHRHVSPTRDSQRRHAADGTLLYRGKPCKLLPD
jgi:hypothetical protein